MRSSVSCRDELVGAGACPGLHGQDVVEAFETVAPVEGGAGDDVLVQVANVVRHTTRMDDRFFRIGGDQDYLLKIVARDMASYDHVYQRLIDKVELDSVTSYFTMEAIIENRGLPLRAG